VDFALKEDAAVESVGPIGVAVTTVIAGLAAWLAHGVIVRLHWSRYWTLIGSGALALSLIGPSRLADGETAIALIAMHLIVGWVLIIGTVWACDARSASPSRDMGSLRGHTERG
jgi:hypothetical protein